MDGAGIRWAMLSRVAGWHHPVRPIEYARTRQLRQELECDGPGGSFMLRPQSDAGQ
jgi:hypothetical protein